MISSRSMERFAYYNGGKCFRDHHIALMLIFTFCGSFMVSYTLNHLFKIIHGARFAKYRLRAILGQGANFFVLRGAIQIKSLFFY